ncbi:lysozyme inhibitor LprI family protein [Pseudomonas sp. MF6776]|uniref:lysozyme inhibitor LprI family protein n=1 Tax=Pseudomonas sp. MF6776 TaxID=2797534 RepID=UPI00190A1152|nr:lysozyme inhibitor LprI family protein [Pseudomonas sp. MF6776]MBK3467118.1 DUF1311 domain-containing protein [Pseudomonas sp. MF6776]
MSRLHLGSSLFGLLLALCGNPAPAASFDCSKAVSFAENTICAEGALGLLDEQLSAQYVRVLESDANPNDVRQAQRDWLRLRDNCTTGQCLSASLSQRLGELTQQLSSPAKPAANTENKSPVPSVSGSAQTSAVPAHSSAVANPSAPVRSAADDHQVVLNLKIALFVMAVLLLICVWLHHRGAMTIYQDYTDALWTSLTPILGIGTYFVCSAWLEIPTRYSAIFAVALASLMAVQVIVQTYRSNGVSLYFLLALFAKMALMTFYCLMMLLLFASNASKKRDARRKRGWAVAATTAFVFVSGWMCRHRQFSSIDDYIAGRT